MDNKWTVTKLIAIGSLAVVDLALGLTGSAVQAVLGFPGAAGIVMSLVGPMMLVLCSLLIRQFGAATLMMLVFGICSLPLPMVGPPGFLPKIAVCLAAGFATDILYRVLGKREKIAVFVLGAINPLIFLYSIVGLGLLLKLPGINVLAKLLLNPVGALVIIAIGVLGGFIARAVYIRLGKSAVVSRIQGTVEPIP